MPRNQKKNIDANPVSYHPLKTGLKQSYVIEN